MLSEQTRNSLTPNKHFQQLSVLREQQGVPAGSPLVSLATPRALVCDVYSINEATVAHCHLEAGLCSDLLTSSQACVSIAGTHAAIPPWASFVSSLKRQYLPWPFPFWWPWSLQGTPNQDFVDCHWMKMCPVFLPWSHSDRRFRGHTRGHTHTHKASLI